MDAPLRVAGCAFAGQQSNPLDHDEKFQCGGLVDPASRRVYHPPAYDPWAARCIGSLADYKSLQPARGNSLCLANRRDFM